VVVAQHSGPTGRQPCTAAPGAALFDWGYGEAQIAGQDRGGAAAVGWQLLLKVAVGPMKMRVAREDIAEVIAGREIKAVSPLEQRGGAGYGVYCSPAGDGSFRAQRDRAYGGRSDRRGGAVPGSRVSGWVASSADRAWDGHGVLRKALRSLMERHPHVALVGEASPSEGGAGATVVDLRL